MNIKCILFILFVSACNLFCMYDFNINNSFVIPNGNGITDISDIDFEDYSSDLKILDFPMISSLLVLQNTIPIFDIFLDVYRFLGYSDEIRSSVHYLDFFRTLKTIEYFFVEGSKNISVSFSYSSTMNIYYNSMIRDLSASYSDFYIDTNVFLGIHFYI